MEKTFERAMNGELFQVKCDGILLFLLAPNTIEETEEANVKHMKQHDVVLAMASTEYGEKYKRVEYFVLSHAGIGWIKKQDVEEVS
jgi:hypothetical protein